VTKEHTVVKIWWASSSTLPWGGHIWSTVSSSGLLGSRKIGNFYEESRRGLRIWWGTLSVYLMRKGWETWDCSAWRREDWGRISQHLEISEEWEESGWGQAFFWWCPVMSTKWNTASSNWTWGKFSSFSGFQNTGTTTQKGCEALFFGDTQNLPGCFPACFQSVHNVL